MTQTQIPKLVICLFDLELTTSCVPQIEDLLKQVYNEEAYLIPIYMENTINQVYYRNTSLNTYKGLSYDGMFDDKRAIKQFIGNTFKSMLNIFPGREKIIICHSEDYTKEAEILKVLIEGLQFKSVVELSNLKENI